jgi:hypothetical protein
MNESEWLHDCMKWRGRPLNGKHAHWCRDWDDLPMDETCEEWPCVCCRNGRCEDDVVQTIQVKNDNDSVS